MWVFSHTISSASHSITSLACALRIDSSNSTKSSCSNVVMYFIILCRLAHRSGFLKGYFFYLANAKIQRNIDICKLFLAYTSMFFAYSSVNSDYSSIKKGHSSGLDTLFADVGKMLILNRFEIPDTCLYVSIRLIFVKFSVDSDFFITNGCVIETLFVPLQCRRIWGNVRTSPERNDNGGHISLCFEVRGLLSGFFSHLFSFQTGGFFGSHNADSIPGRKAIFHVTPKCTKK